MNEKELEDAAIKSALNMGAAQDMFHPEYGWVLRDGEITEVGEEFFLKVYVHKLEEQLKKADEIILDIHAQITTFSKYTASRVYDWKDIRGKNGTPDLREFDDSGRDEDGEDAL